jgi:hypothetical protein
VYLYRVERFISLLFFLVTFCVMAQTSSPNIYQFDSGPEYFNTKSYFYDNGEEVIAFDAQLSPELAKKSITFIQSKTKNPITWLVILQPGVFQFNGVSAFKDMGARVIASGKTVEAMPVEYESKKKFFLEGAGKSFDFTTSNWPSIPAMDSVFENSYRLELKNGQTIILKDLSKAGSSANHTVAYIAEEEALLVSDLAHYQAHAWFEGQTKNGRNTPTLQSWIDALNELNKIFKRDPDITVYASRGKLVSLPTAVYGQTRYLKAAYPIIINYQSANRSNWQGITIPEKYYREFQTEMEQAFPGFELVVLTRGALRACWTCPGVEKPK